MGKIDWQHIKNDYLITDGDLGPVVHWTHLKRLNVCHHVCHHSSLLSFTRLFKELWI